MVFYIKLLSSLYTTVTEFQTVGVLEVLYYEHVWEISEIVMNVKGSYIERYADNN